eukprot:scaffold2200_cov413-Prasinococcus_capsulatus_cf.AAC.26
MLAAGVSTKMADQTKGLEEFLEQREFAQHAEWSIPLVDWTFKLQITWTYSDIVLALALLLFVLGLSKQSFLRRRPGTIDSSSEDDRVIKCP